MTSFLESGRFTWLESNARFAWNKDPVLAHAFTDYNEFLQCYVASRGGEGVDVMALLDDEHACAEAHAAAVLQRIDLGRRPLLSPSRPSLFERRGRRLVLWLVGPVTPFSNVAPAITSDAIGRVLDQHRSAEVIVLRIDSPGGNTESARFIANRLLDHPARKVAVIDRNCHSAANFFCAAADRVLMRTNARMMLHRGSTHAYGNTEQLQDAARRLAWEDDLFCRQLAAKRSIHPAALRSLLPHERYLTAPEAVDLHLADAVIPALPPLAILPAESTASP